MDKVGFWCSHCQANVTATAVAEVTYASNRVICVDADFYCDECGAIIPANIEVRAG